MKDTNKMINKQRRDFLSMVAKAGVASPLLKGSSIAAGLMASRFARAAGEAKRVLFVYTPDGAPNGLWLPNGSRLNKSTLAYEGLQSLCHFREVEIINSGHGLSRKCLGELKWGSGSLDDTIDQQIAACISATMPYESVALGVQTDPSEVIGRKSGGFVPCENSPAAAYKKLFGSAPPAGGAGDFLARKQSVMSLHQEALTALKGKLGSYEREKLESHEAALASIESRLEASSTREVSDSCKSPAWNSKGYNTQGPVPDGEVGIFGHQAELQADIMVAALECGLTNVMTLQLGTDQATWYGHNTKYKGDHHGSCHAATADDNAEMTNYLSSCVAYLVRKLTERDDPSGSGKLIDNTVVVQVSDMGDGRDHTGGSGPNMVATRMPGFKVGQASRSSGNNLHLLEGVVEGLGLSQFKGKSEGSHKIWPCGGGKIDSGILS